MSLAIMLRFWCDNYKAKSKDRTTTINRLAKQSHDIVGKHNDRRNKMSAITKSKLQSKRADTQNRAHSILNGYSKDRIQASKALAAMRKRLVSDSLNNSNDIPISHITQTKASEPDTKSTLPGWAFWPKSSV